MLLRLQIKRNISKKQMLWFSYTLLGYVLDGYKVTDIYIKTESIVRKEKYLVIEFKR